MPVKIENLTNRPVLLRLNSGLTLHLGPATTTTEILEVEIKSNTRLQKLQERHVIALHEIEKAEPLPVASKKEKAESTKGKK